MWSIYDTSILVTGLISSVIAIIPKQGIPVKTRATAAAIGLGLIAVSIFLGGLQSFRYPAAVFLGPPAALCALLAIALPDRKSAEPIEISATPASDDPQLGDRQLAVHAPPETAARPVMNPEEPATGQTPRMAPVADQSVQSTIPPVVGEVPSDRIAVWAEVHNVATTSERLAAIAGQYPEFASAIIDHPNCYPALVEWARSSGLLSTGE